MTLTATQVKTGVLIGKYGGCLPACENGAMITGAFNLVCTGVGIRGGKGTPTARKRSKQATHFRYQAQAFFDNALVLRGEATAMFKVAPYAFIKSLPKVSYIPKTDSEFVDLFKKLESQPRTTTFSYQATGGITAFGKAYEEYFDFTNFIVMQDEDVIIADILSTDGTPFITTSFGRDLKKLRRDDDDVIEIFELL